LTTLHAGFAGVFDKAIPEPNQEPKTTLKERKQLDGCFDINTSFFLMIHFTYPWGWFGPFLFNTFPHSKTTPR